MSIAHPWYKRYPVDFIHGTMGLSLEEKGAYSLLLDLIYDKGGAIVDDARYLAGICNVSLRKWASLRQRLIDAQKICIEDGFILNIRAQKEIETLLTLEQKLKINGAKGGRKRVENERKILCATKQNNSLDEATLNHTHAKDKEADKDKECLLNNMQNAVSQKALTQALSKGCRLPHDFEADFTIASLEGFTPFQAQKLFENFKDYWNAKTGKDATKRDWQATWRNWVRSPYSQAFKRTKHEHIMQNATENEGLSDGTVRYGKVADEAVATHKTASPHPYHQRMRTEMQRLAVEYGFNASANTHDGGLSDIFPSGEKAERTPNCTDEHHS